MRKPRKAFTDKALASMLRKLAIDHVDRWIEDNNGPLGMEAERVRAVRAFDDQLTNSIKYFASTGKYASYQALEETKS